MFNTISKCLPGCSTVSTLYANASAMGWKWKIGGVFAFTATSYLIYQIFKNGFQGANPPAPPITTIPNNITTTALQQGQKGPNPTMGTPLPLPTPQNTRFTYIQDQGVLPLAPNVNEEIPTIDIPSWQQPALVQYPTITTFNRGVSTSIGMHASLLLPGGNALCHKDLPKLPGCSFLKMVQDPEERIEIYFNDRNYALRLFLLFTKQIGLQCEWKEVDITLEESSFDYYHGAILFTDSQSFLFFTRNLCSQSYTEIKQFIDARRKEFPESPLLDLLSKQNLQYTTADQTILGWTEKAKAVSKDPGAIFLPPKMHAPGISRIIGAATSLLIPGWTSYKEASLHQAIVYVKMTQEEGLTLYFPNILDSEKIIKNGAQHAKVTCNGLKSFGLAFQYKDLSENPIVNQFGTYSGLLICTDPQIIVLYLMRICLLRREEVMELLKINKMENSDLGKIIQETCQRKLAGEENYTIKILMKEDEQIPEQKLSINYAKLYSQPIPDLPDEVKDLDVKQKLQQTFDEAKSSILSYADTYDVQQLQGGISKMIKVLNGSPYSGVPAGEEGKKFVQKMTFVLKHIFYLLPHAQIGETVVDMKALSTAQLAIGAMACAGGHVQAVLAVYQSLKQFSPLQAHHQDKGNLHLAQVDLVAIEILDKELQQLRSDIFQSLSEKYVKEYKGDSAHFKNKILKVIGVKRGIPGAELGQYADPYAACAPDLTEERMLKDFDEQYSLKKILEFLSERIRYGREGFDMFKMIEFLTRHAPKGTDTGDFLMNTLEKDFKQLKTGFIIQMLIISGHISYK